MATWGRVSSIPAVISAVVDVKLILAGREQDVPLDGGDILFVPGSLSKKAGLKTVEAAIQTASGLAIWRF